jgi:ABC-2 type transport system ATP-binding protein/ribosome-dependent ATPase
LLGLIRPTSGQVALFGEPPSRAARRRLGYVPQSLGLFFDLTVEENLEFAAGAFGGPPRRDLPADLAAVRERLVGGIGLGLQRRLAFIAALDHQPELLVLDEPTSGVDPLARARLWDVIHEQAERGAGVLVTTHYMQEAGQLDRLVLMSRGRVVATGAERDIVGTATAVEVRTGTWSRAFDALNADGLAVTLAGRKVRVADADPVRVKAVLERAGLAAEATEVPATLEEKMVVIERAAS